MSRSVFFMLNYLFSSTNNDTWWLGRHG